MSREDLNGFVHCAEHDASLRRELQLCNNQIEILEVAKRYGFTITSKDIEEDALSEKSGEWFKSSQINPIKRDNKT